ncbi:MAG: hypothetical protein HKL90_11635 [Elusimicrobia bacterium]|nr:hypothetical protein [Elusimicrobiota bacterium]
MRVGSLLVACLLCVAADWARAQQAGDAGVGVILGNPTGATGKLWINDTQAVDVGAGLSTSLAMYGDYLWHDWKILPQPDQGRLALYGGLGAQVRTLSDAELGLRAVVGASYWLPRDPVEVFVELVPVFRITPGDTVGLDGGIGVRYYFLSAR